MLVIFSVLGALAVGGAVGVVLTRNVVYAALFLLLSLVMIAGVFILLFAEFLAIVQILLYGGAITIVLLFGLMLTRAQEQASVEDNPQRPYAIIAALAAFTLLAFTAITTPWPIQNSAPRVGAAGIKELGQSLFSEWAVPFEVASLVLLVALFGAIILGRSKEEEE